MTKMVEVYGNDKISELTITKITFYSYVNSEWFSGRDNLRKYCRFFTYLEVLEIGNFKTILQ